MKRKSEKTMEVAHALTAWRERTGLSQPEAAAKLRTPFASYRNWETGRTVPCGAVRAIIESVTTEKP